jgi:hypothetical protein
MKTTIAILLFAALAPLAGTAGTEVESYTFADIPWGANKESTINEIESMGGVLSHDLKDIAIKRGDTIPDLYPSFYEIHFEGYPRALLTLGWRENDQLDHVFISIRGNPDDLYQRLYLDTLYPKYGKAKSWGSASDDWSYSEKDHRVNASWEWTTAKDGSSCSFSVGPRGASVIYKSAAFRSRKETLGHLRNR